MEIASILIAEDERKIADTLKFGLEENGYEVIVAYDGNIAHSLFSSKKFDLAIVDLNLPGINGYELCKKMVAENNQVPIIILTALGTLSNKEEGYNAGADDYIVKPFEFKELLFKIRALLKRSSYASVVPQGDLLKAGDLVMNLGSKEVFRNEKQVFLTAKEFQLLEYLLRNKNRVLTRADIAVNVWDIDFDTNTNVIDVYISYLRNKIDKISDEKLIQTQIGMGYVLKAD